MRKSGFMPVMALLGLLSPAAFAADAPVILADIQGKVLVNSGEGFRAAKLGETLAIGDKVLVSENAAARLTGPCEVILPEKQITVVRTDTLCAAEAAVITPTHARPVPPPPPVGGAPVVAGIGVFVAALGAFIITTLDNDSDNPVSGP
jgi:hypothetical protein